MIKKSEPKVLKHMTMKELNKHIRHIESVAKNVVRFQLIKLAIKTDDIEEAAEILDIPIRTGYDWVKKWNEHGPEGLMHKKGAGRPTFLTKKQFKLLDEWMFDKDFLTTKEVYLHIKNEFNVDYSLKQVREIIRKLKYTWIKPYPIATKSPNNAKELLKERTKEINPDKDIYGTFR